MALLIPAGRRWASGLAKIGNTWQGLKGFSRAIFIIVLGLYINGCTAGSGYFSSPLFTSSV